MEQQHIDDDALAALALAEFEGADADTLAEMALAEFEDKAESPKLDEEALAEIALAEFEGTNGNEGKDDATESTVVDGKTLSNPSTTIVEPNESSEENLEVCSGSAVVEPVSSPVAEDSFEEERGEDVFEETPEQPDASEEEYENEDAFEETQEIQESSDEEEDLDDERQEYHDASDEEGVPDDASDVDQGSEVASEETPEENVAEEQAEDEGEQEGFYEEEQEEDEEAAMNQLNDREEIEVSDDQSKDLNVSKISEEKKGELVEETTEPVQDETSLAQEDANRMESRDDSQANQNGSEDDEDEVAAMLARIEEMNRMLLSDSKVVDLSKQSSKTTEDSKTTNGTSIADRESQAPPAMGRNDREARRSRVLGMAESGDIALSAMMKEAVDVTAKKTNAVSESLVVPANERRPSVASIQSVASEKSFDSEISDSVPEIENQAQTPAGFSTAFGYFWNRARTPSQPSIPVQVPAVDPATPARTAPARLENTVERRVSATTNRRSSIMAFTNMFRRTSEVEPEESKPVAQVAEVPELKVEVVGDGKLAELEKLVYQWETRALAAEARVYNLETDVATGKMHLNKSEESKEVLEMKLNRIFEVICEK